MYMYINIFTYIYIHTFTYVYVRISIGTNPVVATKLMLVSVCLSNAYVMLYLISYAIRANTILFSV